MNSLISKSKRLVSVVILVTLFFFIGGTTFTYANIAQVKAYLTLEPELLDFTITDSVTLSGKQGEEALSINSIIVTNNSSDQYLQVSNVAYVNSLSNMTLVSSESNLSTLSNSYYLKINGNHDLSTGAYVEARPIMINNGTQTLKLSGRVSKNSPAFNNTECGHFVVTVEKIDEPIFNGYKISTLANISWSNGTTAQIKAILDASYTGIIDPASYDGWKIGDSRTVSIGSLTADFDPSSGTRKSTAVNEQTAHLVLYNKGGETLIDGRECQYVVGFNEVLFYDVWDIPDKSSGYVVGDAYNQYVESYADLDCAKVFNALDSGVQSLFRDWKVYVNDATPIIDNGGTLDTDRSKILCIDRKFALLAANNIISIKDQINSNMNQRTAEDDYITKPYTYFDTTSNRIKSYNDKATIWWTRSPITFFANYACFTVRSVASGGWFNSISNPIDGYGISPVGCI